MALAVLAGYSVAYLLGGGRTNPALIADGTAAVASQAAESASSAASPGATATSEVVAEVPQFEVFESAGASPAGAETSAPPPPPPTATTAPATATTAPATATTAPPTATTAPPTATAVPATQTPRPATAVPATAVPPTRTTVAATATAPAVAVARPTAPAAPSTTRPAASASAAARVTPTVVRGETFLNDTFDSPATGWPVRTEGDWLSNYVEGQYEMRLSGEQEAGVAYPMKAVNYRLSVDVAAEAGAAGVIFLYSKPSSYFWAGIGADGTFGVERIDGEQVTPIIRWQRVESIAPGGKPARITIERQGDMIMVLVGDAHLAHLPMPSGEWENRYGFVASPRDGQAFVRFDNLHAERFPD